MKIKQDLRADMDESLLTQRISQYLESCGYRQIDVPPGLVYQRGSVLGSLTSFSPRGWKATVSLQVRAAGDNQSEATVSYDINTTAQMVTEKERSYWKMEVQNLLAAVHEGWQATGAGEKAASSALKQNVLWGLLVIVVTLVFGFGAYSIFGTLFAVRVGMLVGLVTGLLALRESLKVDGP